MTDRIFGAPPRYIQGSGTLAQLAPLIAEYGKRPFMVIDAALSESTRQEIEQQLKSSTGRVVFGLASACTEGEVNRFIETARMLEADVLAGLGGSAAISVAKGLCLATGLPLVTVPAAPCCHAPVSRIVELEGEDGRVAAVTRMKSLPPDVVLVDSVVLAGAPSRVFIAGLGDALARRFEVEQNIASGALNLLDGRPTALAAAAGEAATSAIREHAEAALALRARRMGGEALERVCEAMVLLSGIAHESGGPSIAHALARGFATLPTCRTAYHGELVAVGLLAQLLFEARPAELLAELAAFYRSVGLPVRLSEIGIVADQAATAERVARRAGQAWVVPVDAKRLAQAILGVDALAPG